MSIKIEKVRQNIINKYLENNQFSYAEIGRQTKTSRATARNVINKFINEKTIKNKKKSGRKVGFSDPILVKRVLNAIKLNPSLSERDLAKKFNISKTYVHKIKFKHGIKSYKVQAVPNRNDNKNKNAKSRSRKLHDIMFNGHKGCIIMDDETYVKLDFRQLPGLQFYSAAHRGDVLNCFKEKKVDKFAKKTMVWQAICTCGKFSRPFITNQSMNKDIYIKECLKKRLLPLYKQHDIPPIFWPDLATCHYAKDTLQWYQDNKVIFVPKLCNPPNCPELRPIEKFWAIMKQMLKKSANHAKTSKTSRKNGNEW